jgi:hypothetical protein
MAQKQAAEAGDNIKAENERKALFFHHARKRIAHDAELEQVKNDRKLDGKTAQADGIELGDIDLPIKAMNAEDKAKISDRYVRHGEILEWLGMIPSFQPDMFRDRMPAVERREKQGELAGLANKPRESGFAKGSEDDQAWLRGFDRGQATFNAEHRPSDGAGRAEAPGRQDRTDQAARPAAEERFRRRPADRRRDAGRGEGRGEGSRTAGRRKPPQPKAKPPEGRACKAGREAGRRDDERGTGSGAPSPPRCFN